MQSDPPQLKPDALIDRLARFAHTLPAIVWNFAPADTLWKPDNKSWSVLEVICHLADEETEDFPVRVLSTLDDPTKPWPPIDPEGWAISRDYQSKDLKAELARFIELRSSNVDQLTALKYPNWSSAHIHPSFGPMIASDLLAAWCAHDALHLRQLTKRLHQLATRDAGPNATTQYAGSW